MRSTAVSNSPTYFPLSIQKNLNWFAFFLAFPVLDVLGSSITFYLFLLILIKTGTSIGRLLVSNYLLFLFFLIIILSTIFAPYSSMPRHPGLISAVKITLQSVYWILVSAFFIQYVKSNGFYSISKWIFIGTVCSILGFYFFQFAFDLEILSINTKATRNSFVFQLLICIPISFYYLYHKYKSKIPFWYFPFFLFSILLTNGRAGAIIGLIEILLIATFLFPAVRRIVIFTCMPLFFLYLLSQSDSMQPAFNALADKLESVNPRFADLLRGEGEGDLSYDKSWLLRELMVDKGSELAMKYPVLGIGTNNFKYMDSELSTISEYERFNVDKIDFYNSRSAHNSYIQLASETGFTGLILLVFILLTPVLYLLKLLLLNKQTIHQLPLVGLLGITMHFYAISSLTGAIPWFLFGLSHAIVSYNQIKK